MTPRQSTLLLVAIAAIGAIAWFNAGEATAPPPEPAAAEAPAIEPRWFSSQPQAGGSSDLPRPARIAGPTVNGRNGRAVDLGGLTVAQYIATRMRAARSGDVEAAYAVYQAESICAAINDPVPDYAEPDDREIFLKERESRIKLCVGLSPAQVQERLGFLAMAARAGKVDAQVDFYMEGPFGRDVDLVLVAADPAVKQWKDDAVSFLKQAGDKCDHFSLALLSTVYDSGELTPRDMRTSMAYAIAAAVPRKVPLTEEQLRTQFGAELSAADFASAQQMGAQLASQACPK
ncbi:MAG: hypothetical protein V4633_25775 [Pseudomonadota bacterium]